MGWLLKIYNGIEYIFRWFLVLIIPILFLVYITGEIFIPEPPTTCSSLHGHWEGYDLCVWREYYWIRKS